MYACAPTGSIGRVNSLNQHPVRVLTMVNHVAGMERAGSDCNPAWRNPDNLAVFDHDDVVAGLLVRT